MKKLLTTLTLLSTLFLFNGCDSLEGITLPGGIDPTPTNAEVIKGLKEALDVGLKNGVDVVSKEDGYFGNQLIKILLPPEAEPIENTLRDIGLGNLVDKAILKFNRAAEDAATEATPIFINAIKEMTFVDAMDILMGEQNAATMYFKDKTTADLTAAFAPKINASLDEVYARQAWEEVTTAYNSIPFVNKINPDIGEWVTARAIDGLFHMIEKEEADIREKASARITPILDKVFGWAEDQKNS